MPLLWLHDQKVEKCGACGSHESSKWVWYTENRGGDYPSFGNQYSVKRMDWDTTRKKSSFQLIIDQFEQKEIDILIGTQMVSKGLDFEHVGLVGVCKQMICCFILILGLLNAVFNC